MYTIQMDRLVDFTNKMTLLLRDHEITSDSTLEEINQVFEKENNIYEPYETKEDFLRDVYLFKTISQSFEN